MSGRQYLKNQLPVLLINLFGMLGLALFLMACGNSIQSILLILWVWLLVFILYKGTVYFKRKKHLNRLLSMAEGLKERYLLPEIMEEPERAEEQVY
ncbi:MAG: sensor histidine kinase, partial [Lachnospiraceae bacterium]|nr:sensor histidine kinase [Lachnospiraceae bacterium]